ncbi:hypothetical protein VE03_00700 [Pseudogymnoascus sp. 23342-1-I1]|nr:hypothetical protein VE03_00700 [Pseudogymnoascus sp. 23342-1-I1]
MSSNTTSMDPTDSGTPTPTSGAEQPTSTADTSAPPVTSSSEPAAPPTTQSTTELPTTPTTSEVTPTTTSEQTTPTTTSQETTPTTTSEDPTTSAEVPSSTAPTPTTTTDNTGGSGGSKTTIIISSTAAPTNTATGTTSSTSSTSSTDPSLSDGNSGSGSGGGLTGAGRTAVAVVVPIVAVALIALLALWFWRRRKQRKDAEELRRKEVEEYGYNPNNDPTLPAIGMVGGAGSTDNGPLREEESGYRGWGTTSNNMSSGRKASTTMSGGAAGAYSEGAPVSDTRSDNALVGNGRPHSDEVEQLGAMGPSASANRGGDIHRGVSNASSSYSAGHASDNSDEQAVPGGAYGAAQYYSNEGPYADQAYGGRGGPVEAQGQPVIRDNLARRATRIENPSHFPTQASAGISQNF